ncbi:hypothetical protein GCM10009799_25630 [Nocardiopsis rhodophaea]|uniref:Uncharacterized protein n=1 Tax=Nocardiopsis rhodophaea TaxID=280238 RepID=A0ABN2T345_9ACTN
MDRPSAVGGIPRAKGVGFVGRTTIHMRTCGIRPTQPRYPAPSNRIPVRAARTRRRAIGRDRADRSGDTFPCALFPPSGAEPRHDDFYGCGDPRYSP